MNFSIFVISLKTKEQDGTGQTAQNFFKYRKFTIPSRGVHHFLTVLVFFCPMSVPSNKIFARQPARRLANLLFLLLLLGLVVFLFTRVSSAFSGLAASF
jgi:hypothetical protein